MVVEFVIALALILFILLVAGGLPADLCLDFSPKRAKQQVLDRLVIGWFVLPFTVFLLGRCGVLNPISLVTSLIAVNVLIFFLRKRSNPNSKLDEQPIPKIVFGYLLLYALVLTAYFLIPAFKHSGPRTFYEMTDMAKHVGVLAAIQETGVPPAKPFFFDNLALNYYYAFYLVPAALYFLGH